MESVSTYRAKRYLRGYFANLPRLAYGRCDKCHPLPGAVRKYTVRHFPVPSEPSEEHFRLSEEL